MGCTTSRQEREHKQEADAYARRKKNGFKDEGLEQFRKQTVQQKKRLRHVADPSQTARKQNHMNADSKNKLKGNVHSSDQSKTTEMAGAGGAYGGGFSEDTLQAQRKMLKPTKKR
jgi:hypothetical protein